MATSKKSAGKAKSSPKKPGSKKPGSKKPPASRGGPIDALLATPICGLTVANLLAIGLLKNESSKHILNVDDEYALSVCVTLSDEDIARIAAALRED